MEKSTRSNSKIRVLFPFVGDTVGGSHISAVTLIKNLPKDVEPIVAVFQEGKLTEYLNQMNVEWLICRELECHSRLRKNIWSSFVSIFKYKRFLKKIETDIVHTNDIRMHVSWLLPVFFSKVKHLWHQRTPGGKSLILSCLASARVANSLYCKQSTPLAVRKLFIQVDNPILLSECEDINLRALFNLSKKTVVVSWVANLIERKRLDRALRAIARFRKMYDTPIALFIYGEKREPVFSEMKNLTSTLAIEDSVFFMGSKYPIESWLQSSDVLLATAEVEALGRALIEAMQLEVPVIASRALGHREVLQESDLGILVKDDDNEEEYCKSIKFLIDNPKMKKQLVDNAKKHAFDKYSAEKHALRISNVYHDLVSYVKR